MPRVFLTDEFYGHLSVNLFHQLEKLDLIRRRKQGQGKPARVFVRTFVEAAPMPEPTTQTAPAKIPTPIHDVKRPAPPVEEQRGQSATRTETPEAVQRGVVGLLNDYMDSIQSLQS